MPTSQRIYGSALYLTIEGKDYAADMIEASLSFEEKDSDNLTFGDLAEGTGDTGKMKIKAVQSTATGSFWTKVWEAAGKTLPFVLAPYGNKTATAEQPHITGKVVIGQRPTIGGAVGPKKAYTFEVEWECPHVDKTLKKS